MYIGIYIGTYSGNGPFGRSRLECIGYYTFIHNIIYAIINNIFLNWVYTCVNGFIYFFFLNSSTVVRVVGVPKIRGIVYRRGMCSWVCAKGDNCRSGKRRHTRRFHPPQESQNDFELPYYRIDLGPWTYITCNIVETRVCVCRIRLNILPSVQYII